MDYYNQVDPYDQEQLPYQSYQPQQTRASRQYMERPIPERLRSAMPPRMPKAEALALVQQFKKWLVIASVVGFGVLSGLVVSHTTGVTSAATQQQPGDNTTQQQQSDPSQSQDNGGFFQQQHGGYGFGPNSTQQPPVSGSRTS